jgi:hypothetical protein
MIAVVTVVVIVLAVVLASTTSGSSVQQSGSYICSNSANSSVSLGAVCGVGLCRKLLRHS